MTTISKSVKGKANSLLEAVIFHLNSLLKTNCNRLIHHKHSTATLI